MKNIVNFTQVLNSFDQDFTKLNAQQDKLLMLRDNFIKRMNSIHLGSAGFGKKNPLMQITQEYSEQLQQAQITWMQKWELSQQMREFAERFEDKIVLLVYGKVNAGKSSLCNFIAKQFEQARYFYLENGKICYSQDPFVEGVTETTSRIQGVELGKRLILLDTPGLHSITDANHLLTERFTDSADGVLWVTPSSSPGQTDELDSLAAEIKRNKPLLPVISRSDIKEEDDNDAGEIISLYINKTSESRKTQEQDVRQRSQQKLGDQTVVRTPIALSVKVFVDSEQTEQDFVDSGLDTLFVCLSELATQAQSYKPKKARQQVINYLDGSVLASICSSIEPQLQEISSTVAKEIKHLSQSTHKITQTLHKDLIVHVSDWVEELKHSRNKKELQQRIGLFINNALSTEIKHSMARFDSQVAALAEVYQMEQMADFEDVTVAIKHRTGAMAKAATGLGGAFLALGAIALAPLTGGASLAAGAVAGLAGGAAGSLVGDYFIKEQVIHETVGVDSSKLINSINRNLESELPKIVKKTFSAWYEALQQIETSSQQISQEIAGFKQKLTQAKQEI